MRPYKTVRLEIASSIHERVLLSEVITAVCKIFEAPIEQYRAVIHFSRRLARGCLSYTRKAVFLLRTDKEPTPERLYSLQL